MTFKFIKKFWQVFKDNEEHILRFLMVFLSLNLIFISLKIYFKTKDKNIELIRADPRGNNFENQELLKRLLESLDKPKTSGAYFASLRGEYFYPKNCRYGKNIKEKKKVWFNDEKEAISSGFKLYPKCKMP